MSTTATWYHANVKSISRGSGKSAVGLASYITGQTLYDQENQRNTYRGHPGDVMAWGTMAPPHAQAYLTDPKELGKAWNDAQAAEKRINSHLANHWDIGLYRDGTVEEHREVMERIAQRASERYGTLVTWAVHEPSGEGSEHNWHGHLAMNMRRVTETGFGAKAREIVDGKTRGLETEWMRRMIAEEINAHLTAVNAPERISHESYRNRGVLKEPMIHMGNNAWQAEKRGEPTKFGDQNREIKARNEAHQQNQYEHDDGIRAAHAEAEILSLNAERLERIAAGQAPMELTEGQAKQREEAVVADMTSMDQLTEGVSQWWLDHCRMLDDAQADREKKDRDGWRQTREEDISNPRARWAEACGKYSDMRDPYGSLATAARAEGSMFRKEQEDLRQAEARESDPAKRELLKLRRHVEASEYMAVTSERLAGISTVISGRRGSESEEYYRAEAAKYREIAATERQSLTDLRERVDAGHIEALHEGLADLERRANENPWNRRMARPAAREPREDSFGVPQDLPSDAPNRDRPRDAQRPPPNYEPARENPFDQMAQRDAERRAANEEVTDSKKERTEPELSDSAKERLAQLGQKWNAEERDISQQQDRGRGGGNSR